jgi:phenylpyruvate tautomerase PptA (4-oxalocrotonate tautomerase family)
MTPQLRCCDVIYDRERAHAVRQRQGHRGFTDAQKREIVQKLTDTMVSIGGENMRAVTWVVVDVKSGEWTRRRHADDTRRRQGARRGRRRRLSSVGSDFAFACTVS